MRAFVEELQEKIWDAMASPRTLRLARICVTVAAVMFAGLFLYAAVKRMLYPFEVEWIESGILVSVLRIMHGQGLYVAPTLDYVPYLYAPLYLYIAAAVTKVVGVAGHGYMGMRLVSTLSALGSSATIYALVKTETSRRIAAISAAALFLACYQPVYGFYDIGRVDSLFVFLMLVALLLQRRGYPIFAALVWVLVFQTKQSALPLAAAVLMAEWQRPKRMVMALATFAVAAAASVVWMNHATGGWYGYYIFGLVGALPLVLRQALLFVPLSLLGPMAAAWTVIVVATVTSRIRLERAMFYLFVSVILFGGIWFVAAHRGAALNVTMPVYAWTSVLFGIAVGRLLDQTESQPRLALAVLLTVLVQLATMIYNPGRFIPPKDAADRSRQFVERLRLLPGDVYVLNHTYDAMLAGKQPHAEGEALGAVIDADPHGVGARLRAEMYASMAQHRYSAVVVDSLSEKDSGWDFEPQYPLRISVGLSSYRYYTSQPEWFLLPCHSPSEELLLLQDSSESSKNCK